MKNEKIINGLSYISILFAPILFPLIVWFFCRDNQNISYHAKSALLLHILPGILLFVALLSGGTLGILSNSEYIAAVVCVVLLATSIVADIALTIYGLVKGIKLIVE